MQKCSNPNFWTGLQIFTFQWQISYHRIHRDHELSLQWFHKWSILGEESFSESFVTICSSWIWVEAMESLLVVATPSWKIPTPTSDTSSSSLAENKAAEREGGFPTIARWENSHNYSPWNHLNNSITAHRHRPGRHFFVVGDPLFARARFIIVFSFEPFCISELSLSHSLQLTCSAVAGLFLFI